MQRSSSENADRFATELLTATAYQAPGSALAPEDTLRSRKARRPLLALSLFVILVTIAAAICTVFILKLRAPQTAFEIDHVGEIGQVEKQVDTQAAAQARLKQVTPETSPAGGNTAEVQDASRENLVAAERTMEQYLIKRAALDQMGVSRWGGKAYEQLEGLDGQADEAMVAQDYPRAEAFYQQAAELLKPLAASSESAFKSSLAAGHEALRQGDGEAAKEAFKTASMVHPDNAEALDGWTRAQSIDKVFKLMHAGKVHEEEGRLSLALTDYQQAAEIDPKFRGAADAVKRMQLGIRESEYRQLVSAGLTALSRGELELAKAKLSEADIFQPDREELDATIRQVDEAISDKKIALLKQSADQAMGEEQWQEAHNQYKKALATDPTLLFAQVGIEDSTERFRIFSQMGQYLAKRQILEIPENLDNARLLLQEAESTSLPGPKFSEQLSLFQNTLTQASTPIAVHLTSDGFTEVSIYQVGCQGTFQQHQLNLLPGTYTIVGSRDGFRDVRKKVRVNIGSGPISVSVVCEEGIGRKREK